MADPIIRAYGMGQIPEFPGIPEGIVDLIPVDYVVNAILAVAATPPPAGEPAHYNVSSGDRNPLRFFELYEYVREYFEAHPLPERGRGEHKVPDVGLPRQPQGREDAPPRRDAHRPGREGRDAPAEVQGDARRGDRVDRDKARVDFIERYSDLYGMYTETEVVYTDARVVDAVAQSLTPEDRARFPFDAGVLDWKYYLQDVHCPAVTQSLRELSRSDREKPVVKIRPRDDTVLAVFDMEGTIISSNVVESYVWTRFADLPIEEWPAELVSVFGRIPGYLQIDRRDRGDFLRTFFRRYEGASVAGVDALIQAARRRVHVAEGVAGGDPPGPRASGGGAPHVMITAAAEPFVRAACAAVRHADRRRAGGTRRPLHRVHERAAAGRGGARGVAEALRGRQGHRPAALLRLRGLLLATCRCCARSGNPVAVSPDSALYRHARRRRWPIEQWEMSRAMPKVRFPKPAVR